jgi:hypothetical protein
VLLLLLLLLLEIRTRRLISSCAANKKQAQLNRQLFLFSVPRLVTSFDDSLFWYLVLLPYSVSGDNYLG